MKHITTGELASRAELVAVGKVKSVKSEWNESRSMIQTRVSLAVEDYVKGTGPGNTLELLVPGGEVGSVGELYSHSASFKVDEDVVVFVEKDKKQRYRVAGGNQGKYPVLTDRDSGLRRVAGKETLDDFKATIRNAGRTK